MRMSRTGLAMLVIGLVFCITETRGQGGWQQWEINMRDGTRLTASPLSVNEKGQIGFSMGNEPVERSKISYIAPSIKGLPPLPAEKFDRDLVVRRDGTRTFGAITFGNVKFSAGKILQNGNETDLQDVAYLIFASQKKKKPTKKP
jgi:hypothetical protein